jgi:hypothetical protein
MTLTNSGVGPLLLCNLCPDCHELQKLLPDGENIFPRFPNLSDFVQITFDLVALGAFMIFTMLSFTLARSLKGSALRRGFSFAGLAGLVHLTGNFLTIVGDFGVVGSALPLLAFSLIQALFAVLLALAVQSFFPSWYRAFKKSPGTPPLPGLSS